MADRLDDGWHVIERASDGAISCLYYKDGQWLYPSRPCRTLPEGWQVAGRVDELMNGKRLENLTKNQVVSQ